MKIIIVCPPSQREKALKHSQHIAIVGYELTARGRLAGRGIPQELRSGLMVLCASPACAGDPSTAVQDIRREMNFRRYSGIVADFEGETTAFLVRTLTALRKSAAVEIYAPESYAEKVPNVTALVGSGVTGGSFSEYLNRTVSRFPGKTALQVSRLSEDYLLPYSSGEHRRLETREREDIMMSTGAQSFYSSQLCTNYFTYYDRARKPHFVLYDTAATLRRKITVAERTGIDQAFFAYPEVHDILQEILK